MSNYLEETSSDDDTPEGAETAHTEAEISVAKGLIFSRYCPTTSGIFTTEQLYFTSLQNPVQFIAKRRLMNRLRTKIMRLLSEVTQNA